MRKLSLLLLVLLTSSTYYIQPKMELVSVEPKEVKLEIPTPQPKLELVQPTRNLSPLIDALMWVESRYDTSAYCKSEDAVGVLQIRPIMVKEVNRILKIQGSELLYKRKDRFSREKSIEMFVIWRDFHHKGDSDEVIARSWNGGPKGPKNIKTQHYWNKVQKELKEIRG